jgi:hypothetical protein
MEIRRKQTRRNRNDDEGDESDESKDLVDEEEKEERAEEKEKEEKEVVSSKRIHKFKNRNKHQKKSDRDKSTKISSGEDEVQQTLAEMTQ